MGDSSVRILGDFLSTLGEANIFLAVVGLLLADVPPIMCNKYQAI